MLMPGLRVGFIVANGPIYDSLLNFKRLSDQATSTLIQRALDTYVTIGRYQAYLRRSGQIFRKRRDTMLNAIQQYLPDEVSFDSPKGGLFIWLRLPQPISTDALLPVACKEGVSFVPGNFFFTDGASGEEWMRLNFAAQTEEDIEEGIRRLGKAMQQIKTING
jgi:GntR family transcriptional regulator/MocR family aminotransferase